MAGCFYLNKSVNKIPKQTIWRGGGMNEARVPTDSGIREQVFEEYKSGVGPKALAERTGISVNTIKAWIKRYGWSKLKSEGAPSNAGGAPFNITQSAPPKRKRGGQPGNHNATGPPGNKNAEKFGFFSKYLPEETVSIIQEMPSDPLDILWNQIQISYAAIIRAQQIMYVKDRNDKTVEKIEKKGGNVIGEKWEVQQAWDKHANFLQAQARAMSDLRGSIRQYDDLLHKRWDLATDEQKARIEQMKANTDRLRRDAADNDEDGVDIVNDAKETTSKDIRDNHSKVPGDIQ